MTHKDFINGSIHKKHEWKKDKNGDWNINLEKLITSYGDTRDEIQDTMDSEWEKVFNKSGETFYDSLKEDLKDKKYLNNNGTLKSLKIKFRDNEETISTALEKAIEHELKTLNPEAYAQIEKIKDKTQKRNRLFKTFSEYGKISLGEGREPVDLHTFLDYARKNNFNLRQINSYIFKNRSQGRASHLNSISNNYFLDPTKIENHHYHAELAKDHIAPLFKITDATKYELADQKELLLDIYRNDLTKDKAEIYGIELSGKSDVKKKIEQNYDANKKAA